MISENLRNENTILRDVLIKIGEDIDRGEHVEFDWIKDAMYEAAQSRLSKAYQNKVKQLEQTIKDNKELMEHL